MAGERGVAALVAGLLIVVAACSGSAEGDLLTSAEFIEALDEARFEPRPTGNTVVCSRAPTVAGVEYEANERVFSLFEYPSEGRRERFWNKDGPSGDTFHGCSQGACIEWAFSNANLVLTTATTPECDTTPFRASTDPRVAELVEVLEDLD